MGYSKPIDSSADVSQLWDKSVDVLKSRLDPQIFAAWIKPLALGRFQVTEAKQSARSSTAEAEVLAPNKFCLDHVERNYGKLITSAISDVTGRENLVLHFRVGDCVVQKKVRSTSEELKLKPRIDIAKKSQSPLNRTSTPRVATVGRVAHDQTNLNPKYNFSNFVIGACNQFAHAVSLRVDENLGSNYNPLFLYGGVGLGKTHLANAIGNAAYRRGKNIMLVSSELFVNELISALRSNRMDRFKSKFRSLDLLIVDDIQFIIGKERTQEEFFHTFNDLYQRHKQIVITSDKLPQELVGLEERLRTRFASGISADLQAPDFETRVAILIKKAEGAGITLPPAVAELLAERILTNVRELEGALNRLQAQSALHKIPISNDLAEDVLKACAPFRTVEITPELIQKLVAERFNVSINDLIGKRRTQNIAFARHVAMHICRRLTGCSYPEIGALFGGRDHSTVIHANRVIDERRKSDSNINSSVEELIRKLKQP